MGNIAILLRNANTDYIIRRLVSGCNYDFGVSRFVIEGIERLITQEWGAEAAAIFMDNVDENSSSDRGPFLVRGVEIVLEEMETTRRKI